MPLELSAFVRGNKVKIYTTFFSNLHNIPDTIVPVSICLKSPSDWDGLEYKKLSPKRSFFSLWKENRDNEYYSRCFDIEVLGVLVADNVIQELSTLTHQADEIALVCYELPNEFCHRHLIAQWLKQYGYDVEEYL